MLLREPARPAVIREHPMVPWLAVATVCFGAFMGQLDASVVARSAATRTGREDSVDRGCGPVGEGRTWLCGR